MADHARFSERKFGQRTFRVEPMLATKALIMQARLFRLAGPAIDRLPEILKGVGSTKTEEERQAAGAHAISAFVDIFARTDPADLADMIKELIELAEVKRPSGSYESVNLDGDFTNEKEDIIPVVVWIAQEQFGDFFSGLQGIGSRRNGGLV